MRRSWWKPTAVVPTLAIPLTATPLAVTLMAVALLAVPGPASAVTGAPNLIKNPGAESGPGSGTGGTVAVPDWTVPSGGTFTAVKYGTPGGFLTLSEPGPQQRGTNFFAGGPASSAARADQTISLAGYAGIIASGATYHLSAWLGGYAGQDDNTTVTIAWEKASGAFLGATMIGPVSAADRDNKTELLYRGKRGPVPHGTAKAVVNVEMTRSAGSYNDGYADNLSLTIMPRS